MKKVSLAIVLLFSAVFVGWQSFSITKDTVQWTTRVSGGVTTTTTPKDTMSFLGAADTIISQTYDNLGGDMAAQITAWGGTTTRFQIKVQGAVFFRDSLRYVDMYSIDWDGDYVDSAKVDTKMDSCTTGGVSPSIYIPALACQKFRFYGISQSTQSGNTLISIGLARED